MPVTIPFRLPKLILRKLFDNWKIKNIALYQSIKEKQIKKKECKRKEKIKDKKER